MANKAETIPVKLTMDTSDLTKLNNLASQVPDSIETKLNVDDSEAKTAAGLVADLGKNASMKVNVDSSELDTASDQLDNIATIGAIDLAINIAGNAVGFFEGLGRFSGVSGLLEMDSALATIEARTGRMIPQAEELINDLYVNGWGASKTEIAGVVAQAAQLGLEGDDLAAAVETTLQVISVTGGDATETLNKLDTAAKANGISFTESANLFIAGYQNGGDKADDLLDTLSEYGTQFKQFGLSAEGAMSFLTSGLEAGVYNSDVLGDTVKELGIRLAEVGTTPAITEAFESLDSLSDIDLSGLLDGYKAGTVTGDDMLEGIFASLAEVSETDKTAATLIAAQLVGTTSEIVGTDIWGQLSTDADTVLGDIEERAETAGNAISDTLGVTVDTFLRGVEQMATDFLSSDAIDLDGKIETFKTQLQTAMSTLSSGGSLGDAIEIGFGIEGVDEALGNVSRVFGQFVITLLEIVATIQDPLGINDADKGTRGEITRLATQQLPFDIKVANPEELDSIFGQAAKRGVVDLGGALNTALDELVAEGNFEQVEGILNQLLISPDVDPAAAQTLVDKYTAAIDAAVAATKPPAETDGWWSRLKPPADFASTSLGKGAGDAGAKGMDWWVNMTPPPETTTAIQTFETDVDTAMTNAALSSTLASDEMLLALSAMSDGVITADEEIALGLTGNTVTASFEAVLLSAQSTFPAAGQAAIGLATDITEMDLQSAGAINRLIGRLNALKATAVQVSTAVAAALNDAANLGAAGASVASNTTVNNNVSQTNNNSNGAQTAATTYDIAAAIGV